MKIKKIEKINLNKPVSVYDLTVDNKNHNFPIVLSNNQQIQVHNTDEINDKGMEEAIALLNTLDNRFATRFQGSDLVFQSVVSSARTTNSALGEYVRHLPKDDPSIIKFNPMLWEVKPDPNFVGDGTTFPVLVGNGSIPSRIITDPGELKMIEENKFVEPIGCTLIHVPTVYKSKFELQLDQSIQDLAGMTTNDNNSVFRDTSRLEDIALIPEVSLEANIRDNTDLLSLLPPELFERNLNGKWQWKRAPFAKRYCHLDLSGGGSNGQCDSGICILHKEWQLNPVTNVQDVIYVVDLLLYVNAKVKIDLNAIQTLMLRLGSERNANIHTVSADQYQSTLALQCFEASGCFEEVNKVSVDIKLEPYLNASRLIETGNIKVGKCPKLIKELEALILVKGKVTRTTELKDGADALVGAIYNAQLNYKDVPTIQYISFEKKKHEFDYNDLIDTKTQELASI